MNRFLLVLSVLLAFSTGCRSFSIAGDFSTRLAIDESSYPRAVEPGTGSSGPSN